MKRYTVLMLVEDGDRTIKTAHRIKAKDAKAAWDSYELRQHNVVAVVDGWPVVSGVDELQ